MQESGTDSDPPSSPAAQDLSSSVAELSKEESSNSENTDTDVCEEGGARRRGRECGVCHKVLGSASSLERHALVHSGERPFPCPRPDCTAAFTTSGNMHRHLRAHHHHHQLKRSLELNNNVEETRGKKRRSGDQGSQPPQFQSHSCPHCPKEFVGEQLLEEHLEAEHPQAQPQCTQCHLLFKNYRVLNLHRFMVHYREEDQDLSLVDFSAEKFPLIAKAMAEGKRPSERKESDSPEPCDKQDFLANLDLRRSPGKDEAASEVEEEQDCFSQEIRRMKLRGEFPCRLCGSVFPNLRALKGHNRVHLSGGPEFACNMCTFSCGDKSAVLRHMRTHNGDRPYECALCNYAFTTKANCERHLRNRHSANGDDLKNSTIYHPGEDPEAKKSQEEEPAPLDLSMDALDLSKKKSEEPKPEPQPVHSLPPAYPGFYGDPRFLFPYFLPPPLLFPNPELAEMKERFRKELIRNLNPEPEKAPIKMVIKNGVLVPKQKQRRYRTERPFGCDHCTARFTLRSNMERHVKQQHPQFWSSRQRGGNPGRKPRPQGKEAASQQVRSAIAEQIRAKIRDEDPEVKKEPDLASVSKLLDNASTQTFRQYFREEAQEASDEEGLVASHSEENSGSDEKSEGESGGSGSGSGSGGGGGSKKKSAYSLAPNRVSCPYCYRKFPWSSSLRRHVLTHTGQKPFKCPHCPLLFTTKSNCDRHLLRKHAGATTPASQTPQHPVPLPPSSAPQQQAPQQPPPPGEGPAPRNVPERPFKCKKCPSSTFSTLGNLKKHACSKHEQEEEEEEDRGTDSGGGCGAVGGGGELPFKCHLCEVAGFKERADALGHLASVHGPEYAALLGKGALESSSGAEEDEPHEPRARFPDYANRKVICAFCLRRFWSAEDLRRHMRTHTGERPFSCDVCTRRFTLKHSMLRHRKKHSEARPLSAGGGGGGGGGGPPVPGPGFREPSDLIGNLLGIGDVDSILDKTPEVAAHLLGIAPTS